MSMAIRAASYTGDPGFFGDIWSGVKRGIGGAIGGLGGGPIGVIGGAIKGVRRGKRIPAVPVAGPGSFPLPIVGPRGAAPPPMFQVEPGMSYATANGGCPPGASGGGYHLNKSSYFLVSGQFIEKGSQWVRNRKRNPANARATSRAISRVKSAKNYAKALSAITIRKEC